MKDCPKCRLANPDNAIRCDCGYDFTSNAMEQSYLPGKERRVWTFAPLLVLSLSVAALGAVLPFHYSGLGTSAIASLCLALFWLILVVVGLLKFKKRGLWLLIGAPIAPFFPFSLAMMLWACGHDRFACP
jgi:hypothetical protein